VPEAIVLGQKIDVRDDALKRMQRAAMDLIGPALDQHASVAESARLDWEWYEAKPFVETRSRPFQNASNMVYPLIATHCDALQARRFLTLFPNKNVWSASTDNDDMREVAPELVRFWNTEADDNAFDFRTPANDGLLGSTVTGRGVVALQWGRRVRSRFLAGSKVPRAVQLANGIHLFNVPIEQITWQAGRALRESEYVLRTIFMTPADLIRAGTPENRGGGGWTREAISKVLKRRRPSSPAWAESMELSDLRPDGPDAFQPFEVLELNVEWPVLNGYRIANVEEDDFLARPAITVYVERESQEILHAMAYPYPTTTWAFYELSSGGAPNRKRGVAKELEHLQAGISTMLNQAVDAITWSNRILGLTTDEELIGKTFGDGLVLTRAGIDQTRFDLKPQPFIQPNVALIQLMLAAAERKTGMSDPNFGRESRSGGHPAPATSTVALLKQGQITLARTLAFDRLEFSRLAEDGLGLYQAFEAQQNGMRIQRVVGLGDAQKIAQVLFPQEPIAGLLGIDIRAASETDSVDALFQRAVQVDQVITNYYAKVVQGLNVAMQALQAPPPFNQFILKSAFASLQGITESAQRILSAANVDDPEVFIAQLRDAISEGTAGALQAVQQQALLGLAAAQQGTGEGPAVATEANGVPAAQAGAVAPPNR